MCSASLPSKTQWRFADVSFYWGGNGVAPTALQGATPQVVLPQGVGFQVQDFSIAHGDFILLTGPSGAGKSSFLRLLVRFEQPTTGSIFYEDAPLTSFSPTLLRRQVALLPQSPLMGAATLREALLLPFSFRAGSMASPQPDGKLHARGLSIPSSTPPSPPDDTELLALLAQLKLDTLPLDSAAEDLSLGQKQRIALARILLLQPRVLLVDEPTSALDAESRHCVEHCLENVNTQGVSVIMITHTTYRPQGPVRTFALHDKLLREVDVPPEHILANPRP